MKKLLSLLLVLSMILTSTVLFSSCSRVSEKDLEKEAADTIKTAASKSVTEFFDMNEDLFEAAAEAFKGGSVSLSLGGGEAIFGGALGEISETIYFDEDGEKIVSDTEVDIDGEKYSLRLYADDKSIVAGSDNLFGSKKAFSLSLEDLADQLDGSALLEYIGMSQSELVELTELAESIDKMLSEEKKEAEDIEQIINDALAELEPETDTEDIETADGDVACRTVTYTLNKSNIKAAAEILIKGLMPKGDARDEAIDALDDMFDEDQTFSAEIKAAVAKKGGRLVMLEMKSKTGYSVSGDGYYYERHEDSTMTLLFGETEISCKIKSKGEYTDSYSETREHTEEYAVKLTKEDDGDKVKYKLTAKEDGEAVVTGTLTYTKDSGKLKLTVDSYGDTFALEGKITGDKKKATVEVSSVTMDDVTVDLDIKLTFDAEAKMPAKPSNAKDILDMDEDDIEALLEDMENSPLFGRIF